MRKYPCLFFGCLIFIAYNFALSAIPAHVNGQAVPSLSTVASRREALDQLIAERAGLQAGEETALVQIDNRITELYLKLRDLDSAFTNTTQSLDLARQLEPSANGQLLADTLNLCALVYIRRHEYDHAREPLNEALELSRELQHKRGQAQALQSFGEIYFYDTKLAEAEESTREALTLWRDLQDQRGAGVTLALLGEIYARWDKPDQASASLRESEAIWRQLNEPVELATALVNLNFVAVRQGQWQNALAFLNEAQTLVTDEEAEPYLAGQIAMSFGEVHEAYGQLSTALDYFRQSLAHYDAGAHDLSAATDARYKVGRVLARFSDFAGARQQIAQGLSAAEQMKNDILLGLGHEDLGRVALLAGSYEEARLEFQSAVTYFEKIDGHRLWARAQSQLGETEYLLENPEQANSAYRKALPVFKNSFDFTNEAALCFGIGKLALDQSNFKQAETYLERSIELTERLRENASSKELRSSFLASVHDRYETYVELLMALHAREPDKGRDIKAFEVSEFGRARALLDSLRNYQRELRQAPEPLLLVEEEKLQKEEQKIVDQQALLLSGQYTQSAKDEIDRKLTEIHSHNETLQARINNNPKFINLLRPERPSYKDIRDRIIDAETSLLEYSLGTRRSFVWVLTREGITYQELADKQTIEKAANQLVKLLKTRPEDAEHESRLQAAIAEVSRLVVEPISSQLRTSRVIVVPDGILQYVPFQVLTASARADDSLIDRFDVVNAPSASTLAIVRQQRMNRQPGARLLIGFGDPVFSSGSPSQDGKETASSETRSGGVFNPGKLPNLFFSKRELRNIEDLAGDDAEIYVDHAASRRNLLNVNLSDFRILHMVTHGVFDDRQPDLSGLVLSLVDANKQQLDGFVGLADIYKLHAPLDLVVLSACDSALGENVRGEGLIGLTRGFMYAGASSVVASYWKVNDEASAELMKQFYANMLQHNLPPSAALRAAQNTIRQKPGWHSPYFWAGFTFQGDYNLHITKPPAKRSYTVFIVVGILVAGLTAFSYLYFRRRSL
jgi:CHAT domain-containing protein